MALRQNTLGTLAGGWLAIVAFAAVMTPPSPVRAAPAVQVGPLIKITPGRSPFRGCTADRPGQQAGVLYPNTEIEPFVDINPADPDTIVVGWQQDRWDNGGARGDLSARSTDGGATWRTVVVPGISDCSGGEFARNSDPWVSFSPNGTLYYMTLAFEEDLPSGSFGRNAMLVSHSRTGGRTWGAPITLIEDPSGQILHDKNSLTADPNDSRFAYAVWDRLQDFTLPPAARAALAGMEGVEIARARLRAQRAGRQEPIVFLEGPALFTHTTNGGDSWTRPRVIYDPGPNAQTLGNLVAVQPDGTVINFFTDISANGTPRLGFLRSENNGRTFEARPSYVDTIAFSQTGTITPDEQEPVRDAASLFDVAIDPRFGTLYAVWQDTRFRGVDEVAFAQSTDDGATWSDPVRINRTPAGANLLRQQAFMPSVAVAGDGTLVVTHYDFRFDRSNGREATDYWALFCQPREGSCARRDNWGNEKRLTGASFDMLDAPIAGGHFLGDYMGLAALGREIAPVFGIAESDDRTSLFTRKLTLPTVTAAAP